ncbi:MAG: glycosyltransferase family 2 protein [Planctomycetes bacterium]|nr:glycosyltransferase family 2 protein [Planctomycetota bacterium]MCB9870437.1 glycosyltransferase family 2 protein [Planctomycetota bacterium]
MTPQKVTRLSVLFVNYNSWRLCVDAVRSLLEHRPRADRSEPLPLEVIVVDNCSPMRDPDAEADLRALLGSGECAGELVMHDENGGYSKGMNLGLARASGDAVLVCNPDIVFLEGCVDRLLDAVERDPTVGAAAPEGFWDANCEGRLPPNILPTMGDLLALFAASLSPRMVRRYADRRTVDALRIWQATADVELPMLSGCCFVMLRSTIDRIGFFDERFPLYYEDTDLSMRMRRAGLRIVQVFGARIVHLYNRSGQTNAALAMERYYVSRRLYYRKWYGRLGTLVYDLLMKVQRTGWARRRATLCPQRAIHELGAYKGPPVIEFEREHAPFLVETALDPYFYLAAAMFGSGRRWTVGSKLFDSFGPATYYFRVLELAPTPRLIGVYRYTRIAWDAPDPVPEAQEVHHG